VGVPLGMLGRNKREGILTTQNNAATLLLFVLRAWGTVDTTPYQ
jgi:hypothetical protein